MKWQKGQSGNPGGRKKGFGDLRELARTHTNTAIATLVRVMNDETAPPSARVSAAEALLDRGWGRPLMGVMLSVEPMTEQLLKSNPIELLEHIRSPERAVLPVTIDAAAQGA